MCCCCGVFSRLYLRSAVGIEEKPVVGRRITDACIVASTTGQIPESVGVEGPLLVEDQTPATSSKRISLFCRFSPRRLVENVFINLLSVLINDPDTIRSVAKIMAGTLWGYLILSFLGTLGIDTKPLLSLLSVFGLTLGFAAKDILNNTFAGIFILFTRPFKRGAVINVAGHRGKVISVDVQYVKLQSMNDKSIILLPLSMVYGNAIVVEI